MKTLIVVSSTYLGNTMKVAEAMAHELEATVRSPREVTLSDVSSHDLIGLGSGIHFASHDKQIVALVEKLCLANKPIFIFSTRCRPFLGSYHKKLKRLIAQKGGMLLGEFSCVGFDRTGPWVGINGYNKGRPNSRDLFDSALFAMRMRKKAHPLSGFKKAHSPTATCAGLPLRTDGVEHVVGNRVLLNTSVCIGCGRCMGSCPMNVFTKDDANTPLPTGEANCIMCGKCEKTCPADAVHIDETFRNGLRILFRESTSDKLQRAYLRK